EFCTSCGDCVSACPEQILATGPAGTPVVDFTKGPCTFSYACADACERSVFAARQSVPWDAQVSIANTCLLTGGVSCQSCTDACDDAALRFDFRSGLAGSILIDLDRCTGCGACVSICPVDAISVGPPIAGRS
ncbi:MAG: ferredoxin-type protein NapF, partial [Pseudomonadota bacterium]